MTAQEIVNQVVANASVVDANGETRVDYSTMKELTKLLLGVQKSAHDANKAFEKEQNEVAKAELAKAGKEYAMTLSEGDAVSYKKADGTVIEGTVGSQKEGAKTFHIVLAEIPAGAKTADRYVAFDKIIVPNND